MTFMPILMNGGPRRSVAKLAKVAGDKTDKLGALFRCQATDHSLHLG